MSRSVCSPVPNACHGTRPATRARPCGSTSPITRKGQIIRVPVGAAEALKKQPLVFNADLIVRKGEHVLSVGVIDRITSSSGFARAKLTAK